MYDKAEYNRSYNRIKRRIKKDEIKKRLLQDISELKLRILPEIIAYIAGIIDGEGCISIQVDRRPRLIRGKEINTVTFKPYLEIGMTDEACLRFIHKAIGLGSLRFKKHEPPLKDSWVFVVTGQRHLTMILTLVNPYLIVKRKQGELTREFCMSRMFEDHPRFGVTERSGYSKREREIVTQVKSLQLKYKPR
jgi:LAGLIDADG endonuclease